jgi:metal-responsive CopG/Arc/MetJ family transcriptional regulator
MKVGFYLPRELADRLRDVAWYERTPASQIVRRLLQQYVDERKRIPKRPKGEADTD